MQGDFHVGEWLVQPALNRVRGPEREVRLEPKVMDVLVYLARHAGDVLPKEKVIQAVWPDAFVTGGGSRQLASEFFVAAYPIWSPDGEHLLFKGGRRAGDGPDWWILSLSTQTIAATGAIERLSKRLGPEVLPHYPTLWLSQPDRLIFQLFPGYWSYGNLWQVGVLSTTPRITDEIERLTSGPGYHGFASAGVNGERLVFSNQAPNVGVWSLPVKGQRGEVIGDLERLTNNLSFNHKGRLSADGEKIVFFSYQAGRREIRYRDFRSGKEVIVDSSVPPNPRQLREAESV